MQENYQENYAICKYGTLDAASIMRGIASETIESMLRVMGISIPENLPKNSYLAAFLDEFMGNGEWILQILPADALDLLLDIWDQIEYGETESEPTPVIWVEEEEWECLQYLKLFGLLTYKRGNSFANEANIVYIVKEMKDAFYFHLRSKRSQKKIEDYDVWETTIRGLMCYYGMVDVHQLYQSFKEAMVDRDDIEEESFLLFLQIRSMLWNFGSFLYDASENLQYYTMFEVENPNKLLRKIRRNKDLSYKTVAQEDLIYVSEAAGIDNRWEGITTVGTFLIDELKMDYYRATVFIRTMISMIQNGYRLPELEENAMVAIAGTEFTSEVIYEGLESMYNNVPVFELKGHTRAEYELMRRMWAEEKRKKQFKLIKGGD